MDFYRPNFQNLSAEEWLEKAEKYDLFAARMMDRPDLRAKFRELADNARERAAQERHESEAAKS